MKKQFLVVESALVLDLVYQSVNMYMCVYDTTTTLKYE